MAIILNFKNLINIHTQMSERLWALESALKEKRIHDFDVNECRDVLKEIENDTDLTHKILMMHQDQMTIEDRTRNRKNIEQLFESQLLRCSRTHVTSLIETILPLITDAGQMYSVTDATQNHLDRHQMNLLGQKWATQLCFHLIPSEPIQSSTVSSMMSELNTIIPVEPYYHQDKTQILIEQFEKILQLQKEVTVPSLVFRFIKKQIKVMKTLYQRKHLALDRRKKTTNVGSMTASSESTIVTRTWLESIETWETDLKSWQMTIQEWMNAHSIHSALPHLEQGGSSQRSFSFLLPSLYQALSASEMEPFFHRYVESPWLHAYFRQCLQIRQAEERDELIVQELAVQYRWFCNLGYQSCVRNATRQTQLPTENMIFGYCPMEFNSPRSLPAELFQVLSTIFFSRQGFAREFSRALRQDHLWEPQTFEPLYQLLQSHDFQSHECHQDLRWICIEHGYIIEVLWIQLFSQPRSQLRSSTMTDLSKIIFTFFSWFYAPLEIPVSFFNQVAQHLITSEERILSERSIALLVQHLEISCPMILGWIVASSSSSSLGHHRDLDKTLHPLCQSLRPYIHKEPRARFQLFLSQSHLELIHFPLNGLLHRSLFEELLG